MISTVTSPPPNLSGFTKVIGKASVSASGLGAQAAGATASISATITGVLAGDFILVSFDTAVGGSALGAMAHVLSVALNGSVTVKFVNTDPVNPSVSYAGVNLLILVLRYP